MTNDASTSPPGSGTPGEMETFRLEKDLRVFYVTASSFPAGIMAAHEKIRSIAGRPRERIFYGISRPEEGEILYRAATAEAHPGEAQKSGCEQMVIKKGMYHSVIVHDYVNHPAAIQTAFNKLISLPDIDLQGYCIEKYVSDNVVQCMVRIKD